MCFFPTVVVRLRHAANVSKNSLKDQYIGNEAITNKEYLSIHYPIEYGIVTYWEFGKNLASYIYMNFVLHQKNILSYSQKHH